MNMPSNMRKAAVCGTAGLQRMLWSIRAKPAQARRSRNPTWGSSSSPKASSKSPALAARSTVCEWMKLSSPMAAPKSSQTCERRGSFHQRGCGAKRAATSKRPTAISSDLARLRRSPMLAARASTRRRAALTAWRLPARTPSSR